MKHYLQGSTLGSTGLWQQHILHSMPPGRNISQQNGKTSNVLSQRDKIYWYVSTNAALLPLRLVVIISQGQSSFLARVVLSGHLFLTEGSTPWCTPSGTSLALCRNHSAEQRISVHAANLMLIYTRKCLATSAGPFMRRCPCSHNRYAAVGVSVLQVSNTSSNCLEEWTCTSSTCSREGCWFFLERYLLVSWFHQASCWCLDWPMDSEGD